jgi:hypothetical protein
MSRVVKFRRGSRIKGSVDPVMAELEKIRHRHRGKLTPEAVVEAAKNPKSPIHRHFEWNNSKAGHAHRLHQARILISAVIVIRSDTAPIRAFVHVTHELGYRDTEEALRDSEMREVVLARALREAEQWQARYERYAELAEIVKAIKRTSSKYSRKAS